MQTRPPGRSADRPVRRKQRRGMPSRPAGSPWMCGSGGGRPPPAAWRRALEAFERVLLRVEDPKHLVELGDAEDFLDFRLDVAQPQLAAGGLHLLIERHQLAEGGAGKVLDVREVEKELLFAEVVDELKELVANELNVLLVQDSLIDEFDDRN